MIISKTHNFIYIANPRTATVSLRQRLAEFDSFENKLSLHATPGETRKFFQEKNLPFVDYSNYYEFVFIRHPYTRMLSLFYQAKFVHPAAGNKPTFKEDVQKASVISMDKFLDKYELSLNGSRIADITPYSQFEYTTNTFTNNCHIYKIENINADYEKIKTDLGLNLPILNHLNRSPVPATADTLLPHQKARIYSLLRNEFDVYGYEP